MSERDILSAQIAPPTTPGVAPRLFALSALAAVIGSLTWATVAIAGVFTDAWVAPLSLSPDSDAVLQLDLQLTRQRAEIARVAAEHERVVAELEAVEEALGRLASLRDRSRGLFELGAALARGESEGAVDVIRDLRAERDVLARLVTRQRRETERARAHRASGLIEQRDLELAEQALDGLELQRLANHRALEEAVVHRARARASAGEFARSLDGAGGAPSRRPEIAQRHEEDTRLELEIVRLEAERRGLVAMRDAAAESLGELRQVMSELEARPIYQATERAMDVGFVPYSQLEGVVAGSTVIACHAGVFFCREVGTVREVLPGEVVTQDPWGELARGRYALLDLHDDTAVQERILRVR